MTRNIKHKALQFAELDALLMTKFDGTQPLHRRLAFSVYAKHCRLASVEARPQSCLRFGPHWEAMGFQGNDFATDLRGVGILGLLHLLSFFGAFPESARLAFRTISEREAQLGAIGAVPVACASLNFSSLVILALREGSLSVVCRRAKSVHGAVLLLHAALMVIFVKNFSSQPEATVFTFNSILQKLRRKLHSSPTRLLEEFREAVHPSEKHMAKQFAFIRMLPIDDDGPSSPKPIEVVDSGTVECVHSASLQQPSADVGSCIEPGAAPRSQPTENSIAALASSMNEPESVFRLIVGGKQSSSTGAQLEASVEEVRSCLCDSLGYGHDEAARFVQKVDVRQTGKVSFEDFKKGYDLLSITRIQLQEHEAFFRRPGSVNGQSFTVEDLLECEVHVLDHIGACTITGCKACEIVLGPSSDLVLASGCEDCTIYIAAQRLQVQNCTHCTFYICCPCEPKLDNCSELRLAPLALAYPGLAKHLELAGLNPVKSWDPAAVNCDQQEPCSWSLADPTEYGQYRFVLDTNKDGLEEADSNALPANM